MYVFCNQAIMNQLSERTKKRLIYHAYPVYSPYSSVQSESCKYYFVKPSQKVHDIVDSILRSFNYPVSRLSKKEKIYDFTFPYNKNLDVNLENTIYFFKDKETGYFSLAFRKDNSVCSHYIPSYILKEHVFHAFEFFQTPPSTNM